MSEKKWKPVKASITVFLKKFEDNSNPLISQSNQILNKIINLIDEIEQQYTINAELDKSHKNIMK